MADFDITSPDGRKFRVSAPDGATQDQVLSYAQEQFAKMPKEAKPEAPGAFQNIASGFLTGGPYGATAAAVSEGGKALDRAAYDAGGAVTDAMTSGKSSLLNPGGFKLPAEVAGAAGYTANLGVQAIPMMFGGEAAKPAQALAEPMARKAMQMALKPPIEALKDGSAAKAITTMLDEGINATSGGVVALRSQIDKLNGQIMKAIQESPEVVDKVGATRHMQDLLKKFTNQVNPNADRAAVETAWNEFLSHPLLTGQKSMPVQLAQEMKQGTYKVLRDKFGEQGSAATEAQKSLARGLKDEVSEAVPGVAGLNEKESKLLNALEFAERRALMDGNKNLGGLAWLSHNPETWAAFMLDKSALFKSLVARMLHSETTPATAGMLTGAAAGARSGQSR